MDVVDLFSRAVGVDRRSGMGQGTGRGPYPTIIPYGTVDRPNPSIQACDHSRPPTTSERTHRPEAAPRPQPLAQDGHLLVDVAQARLQRVDLGLALSLGACAIFYHDANW